jgi:hypothetical protein
MAPVTRAIENVTSDEPQDKRRSRLGGRTAEFVRAVHNILDTDAASS